MSKHVFELFGSPEMTEEKEEKMREIMGAYRSFAVFLAQTVLPGPEATVALRKLLESRNAAIDGVGFPPEDKSGLLLPGVMQ
jgi:hypothetical protein